MPQNVNYAVKPTTSQFCSLLARKLASASPRKRWSSPPLWGMVENSVFMIVAKP